MPLAEPDPRPGRRWNPWDNTVFFTVDTARIGPLTVGYGDSDGPRFHGSAGECAR